MATPILMVCGKDPIEELGGGHCTYVRAHARAALALGFEPHLFGIGHGEGVVETDYGFVHRWKTILPFRRRPGLGIRGQWAPMHAWQLSAGMTKVALGVPDQLLIHSFNLWGGVGGAVARALRARGRTVTHAVSGYTTYRHESEARASATSSAAHSLWRRLSERGELAFTLLATGRFEQRAFESADVIFYNYESARRLIENEHRPSAPFVKLPYAAETAFTRGNPLAQQHDERSESPLIVTVARHDPRKGLNVLLEALSLLAASGRGFRARLIGGGTLLPDHRRLASRLGLDNVEILGFMPDAYAEMGKADIFVLPSLEEGSGSLSLLEAFQAGLAVVVSDCDGLPDDVSDGENGLLVAPGDRDGLASAITRLIDDEGLRRRLGTAARKTFERRFGPAAFAESLGAAYANLGFRP